MAHSKNNTLMGAVAMEYIRSHKVPLVKNVSMGRLCRFQGPRIASPGMSVRDCRIYVYHHSNLSPHSAADLGKGP